MSIKVYSYACDKIHPVEYIVPVTDELLDDRDNSFGLQCATHLGKAEYKVDVEREVLPNPRKGAPLAQTADKIR